MEGLELPCTLECFLSTYVSQMPTMMPPANSVPVEAQVLASSNVEAPRPTPAPAAAAAGGGGAIFPVSEAISELTWMSPPFPSPIYALLIGYERTARCDHVRFALSCLHLLKDGEGGQRGLRVVTLP